MHVLRQEKKYKVSSFVSIHKYLDEKDIKKETQVTSTHYYAHHVGNEVIKLVVYKDKSEIHILEKQGEKFSFKEQISIGNAKTGFQWLKDRGYKTVDVVKMVNNDYVYGEGKIELYFINDFLYSVILNFPEGYHEKIEKELGLSKVELIEAPYNIYLKSRGCLRTLKLG